MKQGEAKKASCRGKKPGCARYREHTCKNGRMAFFCSSVLAIAPPFLPDLDYASPWAIFLEPLGSSSTRAMQCQLFYAFLSACNESQSIMDRSAESTKCARQLRYISLQLPSWWHWHDHEVRHHRYAFLCFV